MKRLQDFENRPLAEKLERCSQSIVNHLYDKFNPSEELADQDDDDDEELNKKGEELLNKSSENDSNKIAENENQFHEKNSSSNSVTEEENMDTADEEDENKKVQEETRETDGNSYIFFVKSTVCLYYLFTYYS